MPARRMFTTGLATALIASGSLLFVVGDASASARPHGFARDKQLLEQQLASRVTQLARLGDELKASTTLTTAHRGTLTTNVTTASASISALVAKVPTDTTVKQLSADRKSMLADNRVFAVLTPQVFQTIEADQIAAQVGDLQTEETNLQSMVNSLNGQPGYKNATNHYDAFVKLVNEAALDSSNVATSVLAQVPADYPGDTHVFVAANKELLNAYLDIAHANYDATVIVLATSPPGGHGD